MGRNTTRTMAIVRAGGKSMAMTEGSREFCSVLETVSATGVAIPPFIVWQGKTHQQSYYASEVKTEATFAVFESGYMDDDLGFSISRRTSIHILGIPSSRSRILMLGMEVRHVV